MAYNQYNVRSVAGMTYKELTKKTRQYRSAARSRMEKLEKFDPGNELVRKYKSLMNIDLRGGRAAKEKALIYASRYLNLPTGSVTGEKRFRTKMSRSLAEGSEGELKIPPRDLRKFGQFMEAARALGLDEIFGSDNIAEAAKSSKYDIERSDYFKEAKEKQYEKFMAAYESWKNA